MENSGEFRDVTTARNGSPGPFPGPAIDDRPVGDPLVIRRSETRGRAFKRDLRTINNCQHISLRHESHVPRAYARTREPLNHFGGVESWQGAGGQKMARTFTKAISGLPSPVVPKASGLV
jgi:hypothetical protein